MATNRFNIGTKFQNNDIPSEDDFKEIFDSFVHKDEDKADFQMVETGTDTEHYVTPALLRTGLQNIGIITGNSFMPHKENFEESFSGTILPLTYFPIPKSVKVFKNGQLLQEGPDYSVNYDTAQIKFLETVTDRNLEVDYWYKNLSPSPGSGSGAAIDFTSFLHTSGNETKNGLLTFNNTTTTSTSGIILKNTGAAAGATSLDVNNSGAGSGISLQNSSTGTGVKVSNAGAGAAVNVNSALGSTGDILQVSKNNVVKTKIDSEGNVTAPKFVTSSGTDLQFVKGDGTLDDTVYAKDTDVIHILGNESKDGALNLTHNTAVEDVLTITKNNSANCLKLVQNSSSNATTSTFDTTTANNNRKAISIQKVEQENAFITHEGNISGTSFTTLNEKADITDGFLTLGSSTSPAAAAGHAKLYAKTDGTTDMYVMGSDGVEKKIGTADIADATDTIKGIIKLTNDLGGTADAPTTPTAVHLATDETITGKKIFSKDVTFHNNSFTTDYVGGITMPNGGNSIFRSIYRGDSGANMFVKRVGYTSGSTGAINIEAIQSTGVSIYVSGTTGSGLQITDSTTNAAYGTISINSNNSSKNHIRLSTNIGIVNSDSDISIIGVSSEGVTTYSISKTGVFTGKSFVKAGGTSSQYLMADGSVTTSAGISSEPSQITITSTASITTDTLDANGKKQLGKNVVINNGSSAINITVNGGTDFCASYLKHGVGAITFVQASGRTLIQVNATAILNGAVGSTATISSIGTTDYLRISNV